MKIVMKGNILLEYVKKYWFKAAVICFMLFVLFKKDITFGINFNAPNRSQPRQELQQTSPQSTQHKEEREYFTEHNEKVAKEKKTSLIDRFANFPSFGSGSIGKTYDDDKVNAYLTKYVNVARTESKSSGIPASVILANALIHSNVGESDLVQQGENHFALPHTSDWQGEVVRYDNVFYRKYAKAPTSFQDHSLFLTTGENAKLRKLDKTDYKAWAKAIENTGYSNQKKLAKQLINLIEKYQLQQLDTP